MNKELEKSNQSYSNGFEDGAGTSIQAILEAFSKEEAQQLLDRVQKWLSGRIK